VETGSHPYPNENDFRGPCDEIHRRFGPYWKVPLHSSILDFVVSEIPPNARVLDVGAGPRGFGEKVTARHGSITYRSMDTDTSTFQDYHCLSEIEEKFDVVMLMEVIEHLPREAAWDLLLSLADLLAPGGKLIVSTPNTLNPARFLCYVGHVTPFAYDWLAAHIELVGLKVERIARILGGGLTRRICAHLCYPIWRTLNLDPAIQVVVVARRPD